MGSPATTVTDPNEGWVDVPATRSTGSAPTDTDSGWIDVPPDKPPAPPEQSATDFLLNQAPHSIINAAQNIGSAAIHPIRTGEAMGNLIAGTFKAAARAAGMDMPENESDQVARAFWEYGKSRWGSVDAIKNALYHDPVGMLMDFSTAMSGAGGLVRGAGAVADVAGAARTAEAAGALGRGLATTGEWTNPAKLVTALPAAGIRKLAPKPVPAFNPKTATFAGQEEPLPAFDPKTGSFEGPPVTDFRSAPQRPAPDPVQQLREKWGIKNPPSGLKEPGQQPSPQPPATPPAAPPPAAWKNIATALAGGGVAGVALEHLTRHLLGSVGGGILAAGAIKYIPALLKSEAGQQMLSQIGPGSNAAAAASVARDLVPALNTLYQSQLKQQSMGEHSVFDRARGGMVNPELARIQRERLRLPGIHDMLQRKY